jgi:hypothetical protein
MLSLISQQCEVPGCKEKPWTMEFIDGKDRWQCEKHYWQSSPSIMLDGLPENATISINSEGRPFATVKKDGWTRIVGWDKKPKPLLGNSYVEVE